MSEPSEVGSRKPGGTSDAGKRDSVKQQQHVSRDQQKSVILLLSIPFHTERPPTALFLFVQFDNKSSTGKSRTPTRFDRKTPTTSVADESEFTPEKYSRDFRRTRIIAFISVRVYFVARKMKISYVMVSNNIIGLIVPCYDDVKNAIKFVLLLSSSSSLIQQRSYI